MGKFACNLFFGRYGWWLIERNDRYKMLIIHLVTYGFSALPPGFVAE
jgi:hypothetical protein